MALLSIKEKKLTTENETYFLDSLFSEDLRGRIASIMEEESLLRLSFIWDGKSSEVLNLKASAPNGVSVEGAELDRIGRKVRAGILTEIRSYYPEEKDSKFEYSFDGQGDVRTDCRLVGIYQES